MFKYLWIIMLLIIDAIWAYMSIRNVIEAFQDRNEYDDPEDILFWLEPYTYFFFALHFVVILFLSLSAYLASKTGIGG